MAASTSTARSALIEANAAISTFNDTVMHLDIGALSAGDVEKIQALQKRVDELGTQAIARVADAPHCANRSDLERLRSEIMNVKMTASLLQTSIRRASPVLVSSRSPSPPGSPSSGTASRSPSPTGGLLIESDAPISPVSRSISPVSPSSGSDSPMSSSSSPLAGSPSSASPSSSGSSPTPPRISEPVRKQLAYLGKDREEVLRFLREIGDDANKEKYPEPFQVRAKVLEPIFQRIIAGATEEAVIRDFLEGLIDLYLDCNKHALEHGDAQFHTPSFLKRIDRLERLLEVRKPSIFAKLQEMILGSAVILGTTCGVIPSASGTANVSYFIDSADTAPKRLMFFKPCEGEQAVMPGLTPGGGYRRQIAAYLIDHNYGGRARVPLSAVGSFNDKMGSLQAFRKTRGELQKMPLELRARLSPQEAQQAALFRLRFYDQDAHLGNFLWKKSGDQVALISIDFDACLPEIGTEDQARSCVLKMAMRFFPQLDLPLTDENRSYLIGLDLDKDVKALQDLGFSLLEIRLFISTTIAMKKMAAAEFTVGEMLDFLDSGAFKSMLPETAELADDVFIAKINEQLGENLVIFKRERIEYAEITNSALIALRKPITPEDEFHPADNAFAFLRQALEERGGCVREAAKIGRAIIKAYPAREEALRVVAYFQSAFGTQPRAMYDVLSCCADAFEEAGDISQAEKIRAWLIATH